MPFRDSASHHCYRHTFSRCCLSRSGVTASALVASRVHRFGSPVKVQVQGGDQLEVSFKENNGDFENVQLTGPAEFVFEGKIKV